MTREQILHIYFKGQWLSCNGVTRFPRCAVAALRQGIIREEEKKKFGIKNYML